MDTAALAALLVAGVVALTPLSDRLRVPQPVLLTVFGLLLALVPGTPQLSIEPSLVLPLVLPPLLFAATQRTTVREFRAHARPVLLMAVGLTLATIVVVAVVAHALGLPWEASWVLGAIVSPPDPVAATAVARGLHLPHRLVTILEGEGLFNDATALVAFKVALAAAVTGGFSWAGTLEEAALSIGIGVPLGLALGWLTTRVLRLVDDGAAETTVTVLMPYLAYLGAEHLRGSGVLAVLSLGLFLTTFSHPSTTSEGWLLGRSVWEYADFLVTSLVFALVGYELVKVGADARLDATTLLHAGVVVVVLVVFRPLWVFPIAAVTRVRAKRRDEPIPTGWRESAVVSWAGMRGVVTVAAALSVPLMTTSGQELAGRDELLVIALSCVLVTLLVQGLTLQPLVTWLRVSGSSLDEVAELARLRRRAAQQALRLVRRQMEQGQQRPPEVVRSAVVERYEGLIASQQALEELRRGAAGGDPDHETADELAQWLRRAAGAERDYVVERRRRGQTSPEVADAALREIEGRALRTNGY